MNKRLVSIICPVYNEEQSLPIFYERISRTLVGLEDRYDFQILFTNNRSTDRTLQILKDLHESDPRVEALTLSRNFGYQASVLSGMTYARGEALVVIDVDCEDPPEMLPQFIQGWEEGNEVVYGIRTRRPELFAITWARNIFYQLLRYTGDTEIILNMAEFALITSEVRDHVIDNISTFPFVRTDIAYAGFQRKGIIYDRQQRVAGRTHYNLFGMAAFAIAGIMSSSTYMLRLAAFLALIWLPLNLLAMPAIFFGQAWAVELAVLLDLVYLVGFTAVIALYVARIYKNGMQRPIFIVDWKRSIPPGKRERP